MKLTKIALAAAMTITAGAASAETFFYTNSVSLLYGESYKGIESDQTVITFEHFSANSWGDIFVFSDRLMSTGDENQDQTATYTEVSPRFKISNLDGGIVKNLYLATTWEMSEFNDDLLAGLGTDFNIPGFKNLSLNAYRRFNDDGDNNFQTTTVWGIPFTIAGQNFKFDGFWDWATATRTKEASSNFTYQLKWDAAQALGTDNTVYIGIEHATWNGKFASAALKENVINALVKVHF